MKVYENIKNFKVRNPVVTVGIFDGVHLGHKKILSDLKNESRKSGGESVVFTLYPHPAKVLNPNSGNFFLLNTLDEKIKLLEKEGIEHFVICPFTKEFANLSSQDFIREFLHKKINASKLVVGYDHHFGKDKEKDFSVLKKYASEYGIEAVKTGVFKLSKTEISSTKIRNALLSGHTEEAGRCLGYDYFLSGTVVKGFEIGRKLGFPTANLKINPEKLIPASGVYAVKVKYGNNIYNGMLNIGFKPTVTDKSEKTVEVHIFDFKENIYGKQITVFLKKYIRNEIKFDNKNALKKRLENDKKEISAFLRG